MQNTRFDLYLNQLAAQLKHLTVAGREAQLREVRDHLETLAQRHIEQGRAPREAARLAMEQFGRAERLGRDLNAVALRQRIASSARWVGKGFVIWCALWMAEFAFFSSMNNQPTDFPYHLEDRLLLAAVMAIPALFGGHIYDKAVKKWKSHRTA